MSARATGSAEERFVRRALAIRTFLRDPALPGLLLMAALALAGFGAFAYAWYRSAGTVYVALQLPEVISGGIGGIALVGLGVALFDLQTARAQEAKEKKLTDDVVDEIAELVSLAPRLRGIARRRR